MKKSHLYGAVCTFTLLALVNTAHAAIVNPILGLSIGGTLYDVTFHDGASDSFNALWDADDDGVFGGGGSVFSVAPTFWGDAAGAAVARDAIIAVLGITDVTTGSSDSFAIPYSANTGNDINPGEDYIDAAFDRFTEPNTDTGVNENEFVEDYGDILAPGLVPWASFAPTPVPLPAAIWLFGSGLLGLVGLARREVSV